jgi:choline kinase
VHPRGTQLTSVPVFTKLASQLTAEKLADLAVIPVIFVVQTLISYLAALIVSKICKFNKRASNFVVAMAVRHLSHPDKPRKLTFLGLR